MTGVPVVSVIVPTYQAAGTIRACLDSLRGQRTRHRFEVIVVDSSTDDTAALVRGSFPEVRCLRLPERTWPGKARNLGARQAAGEHLAFLDAACVAPPDWIDRIVSHLSRVGGMLGGSRVNGHPWNLPALVQHANEFHDFLPSMPARPVPFLPAGNSALPRALFESTRFPEDVYGGEDVVLGHRITRQGGECRFDPALRVTYFPRTTWRDSLGHLWELGAWSAVAMQRHHLGGPHSLDTRGKRLRDTPRRLFSKAGRLAAHDPGGFLLYCLLAPLLLVGLGARLYGFWRAPDPAPAGVD